MFRPVLLAIPLVLTPLAASVPAPAAVFTSAAASQSRTGEDCSQRRETRRSRGRTIGGILGGAAGMFGGHAGSVASTVTSVLPVGELLGEAIASMLDCDEQQKAAVATEQVTERAAERGGDAVGTTATWESTTRPGVTGTSTVTAVSSVNGDECMTVTDVVIIDGQETTAPKTMCRRPPTNRYVRV